MARLAKGGPWHQAFASRLDQAVKSTGLNQREAAKQLKVGEDSLSRWVNGHVLPDLPTLAKICLGLHVSPAWLLGIATTPPPQAAPVPTFLLTELEEAQASNAETQARLAAALRQLKKRQ